jgi:hypothetical protein
MTDNVIDLKPATRPRGRPRKNAGANATVTADELVSDDDLVALDALVRLTAQKMARADVSERDYAALARTYRQAMLDLKEAKDLAAASRLGRGRRRVVGGRSIDGDI